MSQVPDDIAPPEIERVRHELKRRTLTVAAADYITPAMRRITFECPELADFISAAPDDHIKLFFDTGEEKPAMRDYTPRRYDNAGRSLTIDFAIHDAGPATAWAVAAKPGDWLEIGGPRGSSVVRGPVAHWLLIGDETALPAIGRRIEEQEPGTRITAVIAVPSSDDRQTFKTEADVELSWIDRAGTDATDPAPFLEALKAVALPSRTFAWIGAEARVARAVRTFLVEERGHPLTWMNASGYWVASQAGTSEKNM
ncbi:siderophore-interacting protein [Martelella lutilitoris]|uniref:Siderophore-interacting protein n=1 Tax=Martelella lutilitoris TaxID=2583532 RepID=A0A5C4JUI0_9HYPH|nr:siderophore-interacting protein [Martelella lutilitoris]TNB48821.1 siderophore-interacting protein [Martelella lutilitoris]